MRILALAAALLALPLSNALAAELVPVTLPAGGAGIGFDDLGFSARLGKLLVPGGRTGKVFLLDPKTRAVTAVGGFTRDRAYRGGHGVGVTSADEGEGLVFAGDRETRTLKAIDPAGGRPAASAALRAIPDYVRWSAATREVWVSEPRAELIEIFRFAAGGSLERAGEVAVPGGPESLVIDAARGRAYTHTWKDETVAVDLRTRAVAARWKNGCEGSRGIALDPKTGFVFAACEEGKASVLDAARDGRVVSSLSAGRGIDVIAFDPGSRRLFLPGADSATLAVLSVAEDGRLALVETAKTARGAHCVAADASGGAWVCDPDRGRLLWLKPVGER